MLYDIDIISLIADNVENAQTLLIYVYEFIT